MPVKVKFVEYGEQAKVKIVEYGEDLQVIPVEYGEQMRVKIVEYGEDLKVKIVSDSDFCFITAACAEARGLPDNCPELETIRAFRDRYVRSLPHGEDIIREYYELAPKIVAGINRMDNRQEIYSSLYDQLVSIVGLIRQGKDEEAFKSCLEVFNELKKKYL